MASITLKEAEEMLASAPAQAREMIRVASIESLEKLQDSCNTAIGCLIHLDGITAADLAEAARLADKLMSHLARILACGESEDDE